MSSDCPDRICRTSNPRPARAFFYTNIIQMFQDKTILVTGATDGLGKAVALALAGQGARLLLHGRDPEKGQRVQEEIAKATGSDQLFYYNADLSSLAQVRQLSADIRRDHSQLHLLLNNAAVGGGPRGEKEAQYSADGFELRMAVNYLAPFLLTRNLLPLLRASAPAHIIEVASIGQSPIDFSDLQAEQRYDSYTAYARSKLAQIIGAFTWTEQLEGTGVTVNSLHPATLMNTNMVHQYFGRTTATVDEGVQTVLHVAEAAEYTSATGIYYNQLQPARANAQAYDPQARAQLLAWSLRSTDPFVLEPDH